MAKDIRECLLEQVGKFHQWQEITYPGKTTEEIGGAWEVDYPAWNDIFDAFCHVLTQMDAETADSVLLDEMVYLIARDNEAEGFIPVSYTHLSRCWTRARTIQARPRDMQRTAGRSTSRCV